MATLYWYSMVDDNWDTLGNWWQDSGHVTPAAALPIGGDSCVLLGMVAPTINLDDGIFQCPSVIDASGMAGSAIWTLVSSTPCVLELGAVGSVNILGDVKVTGEAEIGNMETVTITGDVYLYDNAYTGANANVVITGNVYCCDYASTQSMTSVTGNIYCRGASNTAGTISGNADYWDQAYNNYATIGGNFTYHAMGTSNFGNTDLLGLQSGAILGDIIIASAASASLQPI
jgi:hypothetical protein